MEEKGPSVEEKGPFVKEKETFAEEGKSLESDLVELHLEEETVP